MGRRRPKPESDFHNKTGAWELDLLIAIVRQAIKDARKRGDDQAQYWLDNFLDGLWDDTRQIPSKRQCRRR